MFYIYGVTKTNDCIIRLN